MEGNKCRCRRSSYLQQHLFGGKQDLISKCEKLLPIHATAELADPTPEHFAATVLVGVHAMHEDARQIGKDESGIQQWISRVSIAAFANAPCAWSKVLY